METETMSSVLASVSSRKEKASKAMAALHSHRNLITSCITDWENLERSFGVTERALQQKFKELAERESEFDAKMQEVRTALDKREESIAGREEASLARVKEQKDTALAAIAEERRKLEEEQKKWMEEKGVLIQYKEAIVQNKDAGQNEGASDQTSFKDKGCNVSSVKETKELKGKRGSATDLSSNCGRNEPPRKETKSTKKKEDKKTVMNDSLPSKGVETKDDKKKGSQHEDTPHNKRKDATIVEGAAAKRRKETSESDANVSAGPRTGDAVKNAPSLEEAIKLVKLAAEPPTPTQVRHLAEKLDYEGLKEFFTNNRKELQKLRPELQAVLQASDDPCRLSLKILELSEGKDRISANNKSGHACILLLECLSEVVADPVLGADFPVVPSDVKEIARTTAKRWKSLLENHTSDGYAIGSHLFLQLLATFGIGTDYSVEDLLKFVIPMSRRGIGPALCRTLGLTEKIPVVVDRLIKEGKQIDAIAYASAFGLLDKYSPGAMLRSYMVDSQKALDTEKATSEGRNVGELYTKQITALKNAIKIIEDYKLDSMVPVEDLRNRIATLKQERAEIKKTGTNSKQETQHEKAPPEVEPGKPSGASSKNDEVGARPGFESAHQTYRGYASSLERGRYVPTDLGHPSRVDYTPTDIGRPLFPPYNLDRDSRRLESTYDGYGLGRRSPVSLSNSNLYGSRDAIGSYPSGSASGRPGIHSYIGMSRDDSQVFSSLSASRDRPPHPEICGPSSSYQLGSGLPSNSYLPYYLR